MVHEHPGLSSYSPLAGVYILLRPVLEDSCLYERGLFLIFRIGEVQRLLLEMSDKPVSFSIINFKRLLKRSLDSVNVILILYLLC